MPSFLKCKLIAHVHFTLLLAASEVHRGAGEPFIAIVTSPYEFVGAIATGALHIEIRDNLDLSSWTWTYSCDTAVYNERDVAVLTIPPTVSSIRGNCSNTSRGLLEGASNNTGEYEGSANGTLLERKKNQCLIQVDPSVAPLTQNKTRFSFLGSQDSPVDSTDAPASPIWLDNLHFTFKRPLTSQSQLAIPISMERESWLTNVTLEGDSPRSNAQALVVRETLLMQDSVVTGWAGGGETADSAIIRLQGTSAVFDRCSFTQIPTSKVIESRSAQVVLPLNPCEDVECRRWYPG